MLSSAMRGTTSAASTMILIAFIVSILLVSPLPFAMAQPSYVITKGGLDNQKTGLPSFGPQAAGQAASVSIQAPLVNITTDGIDLNLRPEAVPPAQFRIRCQYSHTLNDDPIIFPNQPNASHTHDFFGSKITSASTPNATQLVGSESTCFLSGDSAAYWFPAIYQRQATRTNGIFLYDKLTPPWNLFYYRTGVSDPSVIKPFPQGLKFMSGNPRAGVKHEKFVNVEFWCGVFGKHYSNFPKEACKGNTALIVKLNFPFCWDGKNLESVDGKSHMKHVALNTSCPPDYPVTLPRLSLKVYYPVRQGLVMTWPKKGVAANPPLFLSTYFSGGSGSGEEFHADFMNGWKEDVLLELVTECINKNQKCRVISDRPIPPNPFDDGASCGGKAC